MAHLPDRLVLEHTKVLFSAATLFLLPEVFKARSFNNFSPSCLVWNHKTNLTLVTFGHRFFPLSPLIQRNWTELYMFLILEFWYCDRREWMMRQNQRQTCKEHVPKVAETLEARSALLQVWRCPELWETCLLQIWRQFRQCSFHDKHLQSEQKRWMTPQGRPFLPRGLKQNAWWVFIQGLQR